MPDVVAIGPVNMGKSSLLSALADRPGLFRSADVPGVTERVQEEASGRLVFVDTPGIDVTALHARRAIERALKADVVLWCHSLRIGELRPSEIVALREIGKLGGTIRNTYFVLTHADNVPDKAVIRTVSYTIANQLRSIFHINHRALDENIHGARPFDYTAVKRYWLAKEARGDLRSALLRRSGVPALRSFLARITTRKDAAE